MRTILAIETSHRQGFVAVSRSDGAIEEERFAPGLVHGREIMARVDQLVERAGVGRESIDLVAVSVGPGSYTGTRIGVAAAKAIAFALDTPALGVSTLEVVAANVTSEGEFATVLDARRSRIYGARFRLTKDDLQRLTDDVLVTPEEFFASLPGETALLGEGVQSIAGSERFPHLDERWNLPRAAKVLERARGRLARLTSGSELPAEFVDPHALVPVYLRRSEAEEKFEARGE